jgi:tetratricopeptide (TPR) repeat protein
MNVWPNASSQYNGMANGKWKMAKGRRWIVGLLAFGICHLPCPSECRTNATIQAFNEGVKYFNAKQYDQAISRFNEAISGDPDFVEALFARGACRYYLKSMDGALFDLNDTLRLKPDYWAARSMRGAVNYESDRWDDAVSDFNAVLKEEPHDAQSLLGRAVILLKRNDLAGAARDFKGFLNVRPDDPLAPRVREVLASMKRVPAEGPAEGNPTAEKRGSQGSEPVYHPHRSPTTESLQKMADSLLGSPMVESYSRHVLRGENAEAVGDIHSHPGVPKDGEESDTGVEIVEPR